VSAEHEDIGLNVSEHGESEDDDISGYAADTRAGGASIIKSVT
jgi:hypothetical protein